MASSALDSLPVSLLDLLNNSLILAQTAPYLPISSLLSLSVANKPIRKTLLSSPETFRYVNLTSVKYAVIDSSPIDSGGNSWRSERMDESLTEDEFYSGPLRGIFNKLHKQHILTNIKTLILDGLSVPADLVREIVAEDRFNVRVLSIREAKHLNERKLQQVLKYAVRSSRPDGTPTLKALYVFGLRDTPMRAAPTRPGQARLAAEAGDVMASQGAQIGAEWNQRSSAALSSSLGQPDDKWYRATGRVMRQPSADWADTLDACRGIIAFDAVLCRGPRHDASKARIHDYLRPAVANIALGIRGCEICGDCPESAAGFGLSTEDELPLLNPPPLYTSTVRAAQCPAPIPAFALGEDVVREVKKSPPRLILRCEDCLRGRWCERCNKWWCEACYAEPKSRVMLPDELQGNGWETGGANMISAGVGSRTSGGTIKVYSRLCVESCLVGEMLPVADGMWG
ncbi:hypothetical protein H2203_007258 [Taxawa tesnikishii (nom. ined.)]|nr:hypothetical protein H2203_007258 [Dothideales sp. JES 119]